MDFNKYKWHLLLVIGIIVFIFAFIQFDIGKVMKGSLENGNVDVWTDQETRYLHSSYDERLTAIDVLATFNNNRKFESESGNLIECIEFDFKLSEVAESNEVTEIQVQENVLIPFGEYYEVCFRIEDLPEDENLYLKLTAVGTGYDSEGSLQECEIEEHILFTLEPEEEATPEETPGFAFISVLISVFFVAHILRKK